MMKHIDQEPRRLPPFIPTPLEESGMDLAETNIDWANEFILIRSIQEENCRLLPRFVENA